MIDCEIVLGLCEFDSNISIYISPVDCGDGVDNAVLYSRIYDTNSLAAMINKCKTFSAFGEDLVAGVVYKSAPGVFAEHLGRIGDFSVESCVDPVQWGGGMCVELLKSGTTSVCVNFREIFVLDNSGKVVRATLRPSLSAGLKSYALDGMCGGLFGKGADFGVHLTRSRVAYAKACGDSLAILFLDVASEGFYVCSFVPGCPCRGRCFGWIGGYGF